jgi:hypothetical protein
MAFRTTVAIALRLAGNKQGGYYFYSLTTGRLLKCNCWTLLPMPIEWDTHVENNDNVKNKTQNKNEPADNNNVEHDGDIVNEPKIENDDKHETN